MNNSKLYNLSHLRPYVVALMEQEGRINPLETICELCLEPANPYEIHHTRYEEATYYDLLVVCLSCNRLNEHINLT